MRANLKNGKFVPPPSIGEGVVRANLLAEECAKIQRQIEDQNRRARVFASDEAYSDWRRSARAAQALFRSEEQQLNNWLEEQRGGLLRNAHALLTLLRDEDEFEFEPEELTVIEKIGAYLSAMDSNKKEEKKTA